MSCLTVTEDELDTIADNLRPYIADAMKIEVAPWIKDFVVDMDDLYTDLTLEKIHNKPARQKVEKLKHYSELFEKSKHIERVDSDHDLHEYSLAKKPIDKRSSSYDLPLDLSLCKGEKIFMKGDPGIGKTTQCKKISWDWAMGVFTYFRIVFFVFLKLVKPGDVIENVIIEQNPYMKGLEITEQKVRSILELFRDKCLLILDGLDEHAFGANADVFKIIKGEKFLNCNVIVTSRPHSTRDTEQYFTTVVRVEGFTRNKAKEFASKILDNRKTEHVLNYNPINIERHPSWKETDDRNLTHMYSCPMLLSFMCLLVREDDIDLLDTTMHTGEIYTRMVRCLYKKYIIRRGLPFNSDQFEKVMTSVGKLALKMLLSGDPFLQRSEVIYEVGSDVFDYGLLIGHEDTFRLSRNETADIFVTFPHRSLQEFLGSFSFIRMLDQGEDIKILLGENSEKPIFLTDTLFLQFCLWFLSTDHHYFGFENRDKVYQCLIHNSVDLMNRTVVDMNSYPALHFSSTNTAMDKLLISFLADIFLRCSKTNSLILPSSIALDCLLFLINPILNTVTFVEYGEEKYQVWYFKGAEMIIRAENGKLCDLDIILKHYTKLMSEPAVHLHVESLEYTGSKVSYPNVKTLHLKHLNWKHPESEDVGQFSPHTAYLCLEEIRHQGIMKRVIQQLTEKVKSGKLPNLSYLSLIDCKHMTGKLPILFESTWPHLKHLSFLETHLSQTDLEFLCMACNGPEKRLPNITSLSLTIPSDTLTNTFCNKLFVLSWHNLKKMCVDFEFCPNIHFCNAVQENKLQGLTSLVIKARELNKQQIASEPLSFDHLGNLESLYLDNCIPGREFQKEINSLMLSELGISTDSLMDNLSSLFVVGFPKLKTLTLSKCALASQDLTCLSQANARGMLPVLTYLDISHIKLPASKFKCLFEGPCTWRQLLSLDIRGMFNESEDNKVIDYMNDIVSRGYLPSLQRLGIDRFDNKNVHWNRLEKLILLQCKDDELQKIADAVFWEYLPALSTLCIEDFEGYDADFVRYLSHLGVSCHKRYIPLDNEFSRVKCLCEK